MGDPKRQRKKYTRPSHPWQKERIGEEIELMKEYGVKNKKEIWKMQTILKKFARQAKNLVALSSAQAETEKKQMIEKIKSLGIINENASFDDVLGITIKDIMERRLQTIVFRKNMARTIKQARQFITHKHILVGDKVVTGPSHIVKKSEEPLISFSGKSALSNVDHPEREIKPEVKEEAKDKRKDKKKGSKRRGGRQKPEGRKERTKKGGKKEEKKKTEEKKESPKQEPKEEGKEK